MTRKPCVAGQFYPDTAERLRAYLAESVPESPAPERVVGVVAPHAGYVYSGAVAGKVFGRVQVPNAVVLLGPNHTGMGSRAAIVCRGAWATPLGEVPIHEALAEALKAACPLLEEDPRAHNREHSLEVELPFLQYRNPQVRIVPIAFMLRSLADITAVGEGIGAAVAAWPEPVLLVASSDMTHYETHASARAKDLLAIEKVLAVDPPGLLHTTGQHAITMCGVVPTAVLLTAARRLGAVKGELIAYATSGETSGDYDQVVGYAGLLVH